MDQLDEIMGSKKLPGLGESLAPILIPLVLILSKTVCDFVGVDKESFIYSIITLVGSPIVALALGTTIAVYGIGKDIPKDELMNIMGDSIKDTGMIMLITGAGGALGNIIKVSGIGDVLGATVVSWPIPAILIPVLITGGIHLDGLLDTADALSSYKTKEEKLEILKDSHAGAFALSLIHI